MAILPDDAWRQILEIGVNTGLLDYVDLCSFSVTSRHFDEISKDPGLWATLLSRDFDSSLLFGQIPSKDLYRDELEKTNYECLAKWLDEMRLENSSFYSWETGRTPARSSLNTYFDHSPLIEESLPPHLDLNFVDRSVISNDLISLLMAGDRSPSPSPSHAREIIRVRCDDKRAPKVKVIPNSKYYVSLNRRQIRSMPRKI